jgi:putative DNA primase/helicase
MCENGTGVFCHPWTAEKGLTGFLMGKALELTRVERKEIARELFEVTSEDNHRSELTGLCPVHEESNPSFAYNHEKDRYHCLSCNVSGDLIKSASYSTAADQWFTN